MVIKTAENKFGAWAFLIGVILAVIIGLSTNLLPIPLLSSYSSQIYAVLVLIGLFIGSLNTIGKDSQTFLIAGTVLVIVSRFGIDAVTGSLIGFPIAEAVRTVFSALLTLFVPATIVVAIKTVFSVTRV